MSCICSEGTCELRTQEEKTDSHLLFWAHSSASIHCLEGDGIAVSVHTGFSFFCFLILLCFCWMHRTWVGLQCVYLELELWASCRRNQPASEMPSYPIGSLRVRDPPMSIKIYRAAAGNLTILHCISRGLSCWWMNVFHLTHDKGSVITTELKF